jgi:hypothetical protein
VSPRRFNSRSPVQPRILMELVKQDQAKSPGLA